MLYHCNSIKDLKDAIKDLPDDTPLGSRVDGYGFSPTNDWLDTLCVEFVYTDSNGNIKGTVKEHDSTVGKLALSFS